MLSRGMMKNILWRKKRVSIAVNAAVRRRNNSELHKCDNILISFLSQIFFVKRQECGYRGAHPL
ncbi:MAG: phytanoyl-CoA dioxygenase, partial [Klebsiella sp.]|nr:phytanoyl-CoA dioxygenase [Klebsiella sp.]